MVVTSSFTACCVRLLQSCPTLCDPIDCSSPGSSVCWILQARTLEWVAIASSRRSSHPGIELISPASFALQVDSSPLSHQQPLFTDMAGNIPFLRSRVINFVCLRRICHQPEALVQVNGHPLGTGLRFKISEIVDNTKPGQNVSRNSLSCSSN